MKTRRSQQEDAATDYPAPGKTAAIVCLSFIVAWAVPQSSAGADAADPAAEASDEQQAEDVEPPLTFDLGKFRLRDLRPTRGVTADLNFSLHLQLRAGTSSAAAEALQHWKHRLRDQTITAVRMAEMIDFSDPDLATVQRLIRVRVNRTLPKPMVEQVLMTTFTLGDL